MSPEPPIRRDLVDPREIGLAFGRPEGEINLRHFPADVSKITRLALVRFMAQKDERERAEQAEKDAYQQKYDDAVRQRQAVIDKALSNPETVDEWFINVFLKDRERIIRESSAYFNEKDLSQNTPYGLVFKYGVDPVLTDKITFPVPDDSNITKRLQDGRPSPMELFVNRHLDGFIREMQESVREHTAHADRFLGDPNRVMILIEAGQSPGEHLHGTVSLKRLISWLTNGFSLLCRQRVFDEVEAYRKTAEQIPQKFKTCAEQLYSSVHNTGEEGKTAEEVIDLNLENLLPPLPSKKPAGEKVETHLPDFKDLPGLNAQLRAHMQGLAIRGRINTVLEETLVKKGDLTDLRRSYAAAGKWMGRTKKDIEKEIAQATVPAAKKQIAFVYQILEFCANASTRALLLTEKGVTKEQKNEGYYLLTVVNIYREFLEQYAVELEAKISVPDLEVPDLETIVEEMIKLGSAGEQSVEVAREAMSNMRAATEVDGREVDTEES